MEMVSEPLDGVLELQPTRHGDERGWFAETFRAERLAELGIPHDFVQENQSLSRSVGTVRGLHLQLAPFEQGKLVQVVQGAIFDVAVDVRPGSETFGRHASVRLDADRGNQLWIPPGFAHGFCTLTPEVRVLYKVTAYYSASSDRSIRWDDPAIGIDWPVARHRAVLSQKDANAPLLAELAEELSCES
jgi:dTDP-4-dehydrorhamnose 3,5-epimerase